MILVDLAVIIVGSVYVLWTPFLRTRRAVAFLAILGATLLAANLLPTPPATAGLKSLVVVAYLVGMIRYAPVLAGLTAAEATYDGKLRSSMQSVRRVHARWLRAADGARDEEARLARADTRDTCDAVLHRLAELAPPDEQWAKTAELMAAYLEALRTRAAAGDPGAERNRLPSDAEINNLAEQLAYAWDAALGVSSGSTRHDLGS